jgi:ATP-dependent RNA helicase DDX51/DBP6
VLHRLPGATRPAPHVVAQPFPTLLADTGAVGADFLGDLDIGSWVNDGTGVSEKGRKRLRNDMGVEEWFAGAPPPS